MCCACRHVVCARLCAFSMQKIKTTLALRVGASRMCAAVAIFHARNVKNPSVLRVGTAFVRDCRHFQCKKCKQPLRFALWLRECAKLSQFQMQETLKTHVFCTLAIDLCETVVIFSAQNAKSPCVLRCGIANVRSCRNFQCKKH